MGKVAVWRTVGETFGFTFGRYLGILGVVWLPLLVLGTAEFFAFRQFLGPFVAAIAHLSQHPDDADAVQSIVRGERYFPAVNLLAILIMAWISVGVTKEALGLRTGPRFVYLGIGFAELRAVAGYFLFLIALVGVEIGVLLVGLAVFGIGAIVVAGAGIPPAELKALTPWAIGAAVMLGIAMLGVVVYVVLRLMAFLLPIIVVEGRFDVVRSWNLSKGNVWRLFAIAVLIFLALFVFEIVVFGAIGIPVALLVVGSLSHDHMTGPAAVGMIFRSVRPYLPFVAIFALAVAPILYGLQFAPWAFAYRSLVPPTTPDGAAPAA